MMKTENTMKDILSAFDDFAGQEILSPRDFQDYQNEYIDIYYEFKSKKGKKKVSIKGSQFKSQPTE